ncbi:hypothetical protein VTI74DRAFT_8541 [Chaetomium olivicolor]
MTRQPGVVEENESARWRVGTAGAGSGGLRVYSPDLLSGASAQRGAWPWAAVVGGREVVECATASTSRLWLPFPAHLHGRLLGSALNSFCSATPAPGLMSWVMRGNFGDGQAVSGRNLNGHTHEHQAHHPWNLKTNFHQTRELPLRQLAGPLIAANIACPVFDSWRCVSCHSVSSSIVVRVEKTRLTDERFPIRSFQGSSPYTVGVPLCRLCSSAAGEFSGTGTSRTNVVLAPYLRLADAGTVRLDGWSLFLGPCCRSSAL